ncbi:hypothetical protein K525DRAFT_258471 [Schizophyllum commune Loenen D]|nr:hypothetical protein K525DRAFT_258471 [Schizophyllum commune Loenen D]
MASPSSSSQPVLSERSDVHKSCKSLETLLNLLNDYCEAAGAVVMLQKKLAKALKETAGQKATGELASNALNCSASLFEALADIDTKYAKIADKEYDGISAEVKKWFKRLAKEEKAHDERIVAANARIKQAGQAYEKSVKKNAQYAGEEHARYMQLITALGPEVSQEKYDHALLVTQKHTTTTYSVAACIARVADAEWMKSCESVRRFSPHIGKLSEWRAYCEGGWTGPVPSDLPDIDDEKAQPVTQMNNLPPQRVQEGPVTPQQKTPPNLPLAEREAPQPTAPTLQSPQRSPRPPAAAPSSYDRPRSSAAPPSAYEPPRPLYDPNTGSVRSLSAFPSPPTHLPPLRQQQPSTSQSSNGSHVSFPRARFTESPLPSPSTEEPPVRQVSAGDAQRQTSAGQAPPSPRVAPEQLRDSDTPVRTQAAPTANREPALAAQDRGQGSLPTPTASTHQGSDAERQRRSDSVDENGVLRAKSPSSSGGKPMPALERQDTSGSTSSVVAAMRHRYSLQAGSTSPPPKEPIKIQTKVADLASRYKGADEPATPRSPRAASPTSSRPLPSQPFDIAIQARAAEAAFRTPTSEKPSPQFGAEALRSPPRSVPTTIEDARKDYVLSPSSSRPSTESPAQQQEPDIREKEQRLAQREREIEAKARALEREREELANSQRERNPQQREGYDEREGWAGVAPRPRRASTASPYAASQGNYPSPPSPYAQPNRPISSYSTTQLAPPSGREDYRPRSSEDYQAGRPYSQPPNDYTRGYPHSPTDSPRTPTDYPRPLSSTADYGQQPFPSIPAAHRAPIGNTIRPEKPKGWIRRLSMPVVGRSSSSQSLTKLLDGGKPAGGQGLGKRGELGAVAEDGVLGERRSYDVPGNRSYTNLARR